MNGVMNRNFAFLVVCTITLASCMKIELPADQRTPKCINFATSVVDPARIQVIGRNGRTLDILSERYPFDHANAKEIFLDGRKVGEFPAPDHFDRQGKLAQRERYLELGKVPLNGKIQELDGFDVTELKNGQMLLTGGQIRQSDGPPLPHTWILDKHTNKCTQGPDLNSARAWHQATLLRDGRVLISGGMFPWGTCSVLELEIYDPKLNKVKVVGKLNKPREFHQTIELPNHSAAIIGGETAEELHDAGDKLTSTIEVLDFDKQTVKVVGQLHNARQGFFAFPLADGKVLIAGGMMDGYFDNPANSSVRQVEIFPGEK